MRLAEWKAVKIQETNARILAVAMPDVQIKLWVELSSRGFVFTWCLFRWLSQARENKKKKSWADGRLIAFGQSRAGR